MPEPEHGFAAVVIVAAGSGTRFGAPDKVLLPLNGQPVLAHALDSAEAAATVRDAVVVVGDHTRVAVETLIGAGPWTKVRRVVVGGARRQDSVVRGAAAVAGDVSIVVVHDGARPLAPASLFDACARAAWERGAAIAAVPVADTLKRVAGDRIAATVSRDGLWAAQTPQAFRRDVLARAFAFGDRDPAGVTDEAALVEALGEPVFVVEGRFDNLKITRQDDLALAHALLQLRDRRP